MATKEVLLISKNCSAQNKLKEMFEKYDAR